MMGQAGSAERAAGKFQSPYSGGPARAWSRQVDPSAPGRMGTPSSWGRSGDGGTDRASGRGLGFPEAGEGESLVRLRGELHALRERLRLHEEERVGLESRYRSMETGYQARVADLEARVEALGRELDVVRRDRRSGAQDSEAAPPQVFMARPLVVRSEGGEYLGVLGRGGRHFTLRDFVSMLEQHSGPALTIGMGWESRGGNWTLQVEARDVAGGQAQKMVLVVRELVTPSSNQVAHILRFNIDGRDVSESLLLGLFKQIRSGLDG